MTIIDLTCKNCHGVMKVNSDETMIICEHCGATNWIADNDDIRRDKVRYKHEKEMYDAKVAQARERSDIEYKKLKLEKMRYVYLAAIIAIIIFIITVIVPATKKEPDPNMLVPPASYNELIGKHYNEVVNMFTDSGFENIELVPKPVLQSKLFYDATKDVGKVVAVSINGKEKFNNCDTLFSSKDTFSKNANVKIVFETWIDNRSPEEKAADEQVNRDWTEAPVILHAYESGKDWFTLKWEGKAPVYIVMLDGNQKTVEAGNSSTFKLENGLHTIQIVPVNRDALRYDIENVQGTISIKAPVSFDLSNYHLSRDHLVHGLMSDKFEVDYSASTIYDKAPSNLKARIDLQNAVHLEFVDSTKADKYLVTYKTNNIEHTVTIDKAEANVNGDSVEIILSPELLQQKECPPFDVDKDYSVTVSSQIASTDLIEQKSSDKMLSSRSTSVNFKTTAAWKDAPVIVSGEQTADGEITIRWTHPAADMGCRYSVSILDKFTFVTTKESEKIKTEKTEAVIRDLQNGSYTIIVTPENNGEKGSSSAEYTITVNNNWSQAPEIEVSQINSRSAKVRINHIYGIDAYAIKVSCGNPDNLLRFVDLDYALYGEYTVDAVSPVTEYTFDYEKDIAPDKELKVKFEIYGIHYAEDNAEQHSATKTEQIVLKP